MRLRRAIPKGGEGDAIKQERYWWKKRLLGETENELLEREKRSGRNLKKKK